MQHDLLPPSPFLISMLPNQASAEPSIIRFLNPVLITPPAPNAGTIRAILAKLLPSQSRLTLLTLSRHPTDPLFPLLLPAGRLYRSSPHRCSGVLSNCIPAGARNCAALCLLKRASTSLLKVGSKGAISGGRLNDAKTVSESRTAKRA